MTIGIHHIRRGALALVLASGALAGSTALSGGSAAAAGCCADYARDTTVKGESKEVVTQLTERINAMQLAIIEALRLGAGQASGNSKESIASESNIAGVQDDRATVGRAESARFEALRESASAPSACSTITAARAGSTISAAAAQANISLASEFVARNVGAHDSASVEVEEARNDRLAKHCELFATTQDVSSGLCPSPGKMPLADVTISQSVFYQDPGSDVRGLDEDRAQAGALFVANSIDPIPQGPMLKGEATTPEGRIKAAARFASAARTSVALDAALNVLSRRQKTTDGAEALQAKAATIDGYNGDLSKGYSEMDYLDVMSRSWHFSSKANTALNGAGLSEAVKELVLIQGYSAYQDFKTYELVEKQTMILAQMLAIMAETTRPDRGVR